MKDIIIVGGGASGLMTGVIAARRGKKVTILEHKDRVGKKILATGNGRCNYTNSYMDISCFRSDNIDFVKKVLGVFPYEATVDFFMELGIYPKQIKGYIYPNSEQAISVRDVLELEALHLGVNIICNISVESIKKVENYFVIRTNQGELSSQKVVLSNGGCASSSLGSDGSGFQLAKDLKHSIIKPLPGLVQLKSNENFFKIVAGVRTDAYIEVYINNKLKAKERGELQFTKYGVSGIPILQISRYVSKALNASSNVLLKLDLMADFDFSQYDYVVDAIDTVTGKLEIIEKAYQSKVPVISAMGAGNKLDPTKLELADIYETSICPLAKVMRKELRARGIKQLKVVYSKEVPIKPLIQVNEGKEEEEGQVPSGQGSGEKKSADCKVAARETRKKRATPGSVSFVPPVAGLIIAGEVIKDLGK